ncbi:MAG TPA: ZIP family metal transporter [Alphaproteobacteria bacterium]|jgi:ZIP family zinc transporter
MPSAYVAVLLLSLLSVATTCVGVILAALIRESTRAIAIGIGFSAGIMILVSVVELIPAAHAVLGAEAAGLAVALGAGFLLLANFAIPHTHIVPEHGLADTRLVRSVYLIVAGLILHDVPEGFAMANAYVASPSLGLLVGLAIALHNLPEELAMAIPAMALRSKPFLLGAAILSALAEPVGAIIGLFAVGIWPGLNAYFMGFAAGAMIFVSIHELVPMARRFGRIGWFAAGVVLSVAAHRLLAIVTVG